MNICVGFMVSDIPTVRILLLSVTFYMRYLIYSDDIPIYSLLTICMSHVSSPNNWPHSTTLLLCDIYYIIFYYAINRVFTL